MKTHAVMIRLSIAHFFVDTYSSMLGPFLPFLVPAMGLNMTEAGLLGSVLVLSSSLMQPLYGYLSDRFHRQIFLTAAPAVAGVFISSLGLAGNLGTASVLAFLGGVGIAAFHPQAAAVTARTKKRNPGVQLSIFITAGTLGFSFGPFFISSIVSAFGTSNSYWAALPGVLVSLYLMSRGRFAAETRVKPPRGRVAGQLRKYWKELSLLFAIVVSRSAIQLVFVSFLPLYLTTRGFSAYEAGQTLTIYLVVGAIAVFLGGFLSDNLGEKKVILLGMAGTFPFLLGFLATQGSVSMALLLAGAWFLYLTLPVNLAMAQRLVPESASTVSAIMMGFAWGVGGVALPLTGILSDAWGLEASLKYLVWVNVPVVVLAALLPSATAPVLQGESEGLGGQTETAGG